jgi:transcriptional regulator with XRE-family HTH domain
MSDASVAVGARIRESREAKGWNQDTLARKLGVTWVTISRWERGINAPPINRLRLLSEVLGVSAEDLLDEKVAA